MRVAARKTQNGTVPKREQLMSEHQRAAPLSKLFPQIEQLRIELVFNDPNARSPPPSPQLRTLYSAAPAFFRFTCPCADCDGDFDLTEAVTALITGGAGRKRVSSLDGQLRCQGVRFRDHTGHQTACQMQLSFRLRIQPHHKALANNST
jgi:hypothetical protein